LKGYTTKVNELPTIVTRRQQKTTVITKTTAKSMTSSQERTDYKSDTSSKQPIPVLTSVKDKANLQKTHPQEKEQSSGCILISLLSSFSSLHTFPRKQVSSFVVRVCRIIFRSLLLKALLSRTQILNKIICH
jgi:hypothetical protein